MTHYKKPILATFVLLGMTACGSTGIDAVDEMTSNLNGENTTSTQNSVYSSLDLSNVDFSKYDVSSPVKELAKQDISQAKTVGTIVGALAGIAYCEDKISKNMFGRSALVLTCIKVFSIGGEKLGKYVGDSIALRRLSYASEYEFLESEIEASQSAVTTREAELEVYEQEITKIENDIKILQQNKALTQAQISEARAMREEVTAKLENNQKLELSYQDTLLYLDSLLESSESMVEENQADEAKKEQKVLELKEKRKRLSVQLGQVQNQSVRLKSSETILKTVVA